MIHPERLILKAQVHVPIEPLKTWEGPLTRFSGKQDIFGVVLYELDEPKFLGRDVHFSQGIPKFVPSQPFLMKFS